MTGQAEICKTHVRRQRAFRGLRTLLWAAAFISLASAARADVAVPVIGLFTALAPIVLIPVVLIEAWTLCRSLNVRFRRVLAAVTLSNIASALVGVPISWLVYVLAEVWALEAHHPGGAHEAASTFGRLAGEFRTAAMYLPWVDPERTQSFWQIPAVMLVLLPAFFTLSWIIEWPVVQWMQRGVPRSEVRGAVFNANIASYCLIALILAAAVVRLAWTRH